VPISDKNWPEKYRRIVVMTLEALTCAPGGERADDTRWPSHHGVRLVSAFSGSLASSRAASSPGESVARRVASHVVRRARGFERALALRGGTEADAAPVARVVAGARDPPGGLHSIYVSDQGRRGDVLQLRELAQTDAWRATDCAQQARGREPD
jgi:hypothetical protein